MKKTRWSRRGKARQGGRQLVPSTDRAKLAHQWNSAATSGCSASPKTDWSHQSEAASGRWQSSRKARGVFGRVYRYLGMEGQRPGEAAPHDDSGNEVREADSSPSIGACRATEPPKKRSSELRGRGVCNGGDDTCLGLRRYRSHRSVARPYSTQAVVVAAWMRRFASRADSSWWGSLCSEGGAKRGSTTYRIDEVRSRWSSGTQGFAAKRVLCVRWDAEQG